MHLFKRFLPQLVIIFVLCVLSGVGIVKENIVSTAARTNNAPKIIIDAGHGGLTNTTD